MHSNECYNIYRGIRTNARDFLDKTKEVFIMKTKKIAVIISFFLAAVLCFTGCASKESMLIGSWRFEDGTSTVMTFNEDHTVMDDKGEMANWTLLEDGSLKIYLGSNSMILDTGSLGSGRLSVSYYGTMRTLVKE